MNAQVEQKMRAPAAYLVLYFDSSVRRNWRLNCEIEKVLQLLDLSSGKPEQTEKE